MKMRLTSVTIMLAAALLALCTAAYAQKSHKTGKAKVPAAVFSAFKKAHPEAKVKAYLPETRDGQECYEIESRLNGMTLDVVYLPDGTVLEQEEGIKATELPEPVQSAIASDYAGAKVKKAEKLTRGNVVEYEVTLKLKRKLIEVVFGSGGKELRKAKAD